MFFEFGDRPKADEFLNKAQSIQASAHSEFFKAQEKRLISARFLQNKDYENAIKVLDDAPQNYKNYISLANIFLQIKDFSKMDENIKKAENSALAASQKAQVLAFKAFVFLNQNDLKSAENLAQSALSLAPKLRLALLILNNIYLLEKNHKKLIEISYKILQNHPFNEAVFSTLSGVLYENGNYDESIKIAKIALEYYPNSHTILANLATALHENKQIEKATQIYKKALEIKPNTSQILNNLASIAVSKNDFTSALEYINKALEIEPSNLQMLINKANVMISLQIEPTQVQKIAAKAGVFTPKHALTHSQNACI